MESRNRKQQKEVEEGTKYGTRETEAKVTVGPLGEWLQKHK
jgi:hypothetical protein